MKKYFYLNLIVLLGFFLSSKSLGQSKEPVYYEFSKKYVFTSAVIQSEFPVHFREIKIVTREESITPKIYWTIENNSDKPVKSYSVAFRIFHSVQEWKSFGPVLGFSETYNKDIPLILPKKSYTNDIITPKPIPSSMEEKIFSKSKSKEDAWFTGIVCIGIIKEVEFMDGTKIEADKTLFDDF
ncbi:MAG: hypothetical protein K1X72_22090 [Pyrinomonadaceae bacterium]|nr:hypothetical protein [Pyrinomonadaceae bacterium]